MFNPIDYDPYELCPCASRKKLKFCCWRNRKTWYVKPQSISLRGPSTNYQHPKCYANQDHNCSTKISNEHYLAESALEVIGQTIKVSGLKIFPPNGKELPIGEFASNILCTRHNEALSDFDDVAKNLFKTLNDYQEECINISKPLKNSFRLFSGEDIEKILLKALCGITAKKVVAVEYKNIEAQRNLWVDILFGRAPWPKGWGLYCRSYAPETVEQIRIQLDMGLGIGNSQNITRYGITFAKHHFMIRVADNVLMNNTQESSLYRPEHIVIERRTNNDIEAEKVIGLTWNEVGEGGSVRIKMNYIASL